MHNRFGYYSTDWWYQGTVDQIVKPRCRWIDVGGGKTVFPHNKKLATELASRCELLISVDPSENIEHNDIAHRRVRTTIERFTSEETYDLATLRMVAEHIESPVLVVESLARLITPGGHVVVYTPNKWSPASIVASIVPNRWHHYFTSLLWGTKEEDVFPTKYRMNRRKRLRELFHAGGFEEVAFARLANCSVMQRFRLTCFLELCLWKIFRAVHVDYPENNLLGVYKRI